MPLEISTEATTDKNKLISSVVWIDLVQFEYSTEDPVRICSYDEPVSWNGYSWTPVAFTKPEIEETKEAQIPDVSISFHDITQEIIPIIDKYDGAVGATVTLYTVLSTQLSSPTPEIEESMEVLSTSIDSRSIITFKLGAENLLNQKCTPNRFLKNFCRYTGLDDDRCAYTGTETECNRTFARCKELGNQERFGGMPAIGRLGYQG
jgi:phage-related protein